MSECPEEPNEVSDEESLLPIDEHIEEEHGAEGRKVRRCDTYLPPNLLTTAALSSGFYAITNGMSGQFTNAAIAISVAMVLDGLDGRVARLTNTQSAFGAEYDSLPDMIAFGVVPALVTFEQTLGGLGKVDWMVAFIYVTSVALHLARFSTQVSKADKRYLISLASPAVTALVAGTVWALNNFEIQGAKVALLVALLVVAAGMLMVSNIKYHSFKDLDLHGRVPFMAVLIMVLTFAAVFTDPPYILLLLFLTYVASGPVQYLLQLRRQEQSS